MSKKSMAQGSPNNAIRSATNSKTNSPVMAKRQQTNDLEIRVKSPPVTQDKTSSVMLSHDSLNLKPIRMQNSN